MERLSIVLIGLFISFLFSVSSVQAITIQKAGIAKGAVQVKGKGAVPGADISWEGQVVTQANNNGNFNFSTPILPGDCVGELSDGAETVQVVVKSCGQQGTQGPQGDQGPPGPAGETRFVYVGNTDTSLPGGAGMATMSRECAADFGNEARMCTSKEAMLTGNPPQGVGIAGKAWIHPLIVGAGGIFTQFSDNAVYFGTFRVRSWLLYRGLFANRLLVKQCRSVQSAISHWLYPQPCTARTVMASRLVPHSFPANRLASPKISELEDDR